MIFLKNLLVDASKRNIYYVFRVSLIKDVNGHNTIAISKYCYMCDVYMNIFACSYYNPLIFIICD